MARQDFQLPGSWKKQLKELAKKKGATVAQLIRDALYEKYFKKEQQETK